ncbi:MAG TPA: hypothetical protein VIG82_02675, partial [Enteractinococcus sp.]
VVSTFVVLALVVSESEARSLLENYVGEEGVPIAAAAGGVITLIAMYFLVRRPRKERKNSSAARRSSATQDG